MGLSRIYEYGRGCVFTLKNNLKAKEEVKSIELFVMNII